MACFDVEQKGEGLAGQGLYALKGEARKRRRRSPRHPGVCDTILQLEALCHSRGVLYGGEGYIGSNQLTEDINYLRCLSNIGLVYLVRRAGRTNRGNTLKMRWREARRMQG